MPDPPQPGPDNEPDNEPDTEPDLGQGMRDAGPGYATVMTSRTGPAAGPV